PRPAPNQDNPANRQQYDPPAMPLHEMAGAHERFGDGGQVAFFGQLSEDRLEFRHEENDQHIEHDEADDRQEYRISHGADDLRLEVFLVLGEGGVTGGHVFEEPACVASYVHLLQTPNLARLL